MSRGADAASEAQADADDVESDISRAISRPLDREATGDGRDLMRFDMMREGDAR